MRALTLTVITCVLAGHAAAAGLADRVTRTPITLPHNLESSIGSWGTWGGTSLGPRLYLVPRPDGAFYLGWTDQSGTGRISRISGGTATEIDSFPGRRLKGLVVHDDGSYAVLQWNEATETLKLVRYGPTGNQLWAPTLDTVNTEFDDWLGDARLSYGDGTYAAYYTVYGTGSWMAGHYGDQLVFVNASGSPTGGWEWGCSHSMAELVAWHPSRGWVALCSSDCYPSKGLVRDNSQNLVPSDGDCGGMVSLQLGQMAAGDDEWKAIFNAMEIPPPCCDAQGIGFVRFGGPAGTVVTWLTNTSGDHERDPVMARLPDGPSGAERYLVGWRMDTTGGFYLAMVDGSGSLVEGPEPVSTAGISWGNRDDSFQSGTDGSVSWVFGAAGSSTLVLHTYRDDAIFADGFESGDPSAWSSTSP